MTRAAFALTLAVVCVACTPDATGRRSFHLDSASAEYTEDRPGGGNWDKGISPGPEVEGRFVVDGTAYGSCSKRWTAFEVECSLDVDVELGPESRVEIVVEDDDGETADRMGGGTLEQTLRNLPKRGEATLALTADGSVQRASLMLKARWEPRVPMESARVLVVIGGIALAFALAVVLRRRFLTVNEHYLGSVAFVSAGLAALVAWLVMLPALDHEAVLEPLLVSSPMGLGAYSLTAVIIDGYATRHWGKRRTQVALAAVGALIIVPVALSVTLLSPSVVVIVLVLGAGMFL